MSENEMHEYSRRHNTTDSCPLSDIEREGKIREVMKSELHSALNEYFLNSPFAVQQEQHYQDHTAMKKFRHDADTVKTSFLKAAGRLFAMAVIGAISWSALAKFLFKE